MPSTRIRLAAVTSHPRHAVIAAVTAALNDVGWIVDFHQFSNAAIAVSFELPASALSALRRTIDTLPLRLSNESLAALSALECADPSSVPDPVPGAINVTFFHEEPDLRIPVPAVPG